MHKKQKPKLLHITSSLKMGGAERVLVDLIEALRDDYVHEVIFFHDGPHTLTLERLGIPCRKVTGLIGLYDPVFWFRLARAIKQAKPGCIHSLLWGANWASRLLGPLFRVPVVNALHNNVEGYSRMRRFLDVCTLARADSFVAVSEGVQASHQRIYPLLTIDRVTVISNGVTVRKSVPIDRALLGLMSDHFVFGYVGRFETEKNPALLVRAFALLAVDEPQARLVLVGYGSQEQTLRDLVLQLNIPDRVVFVIGQPAASYYTLFDCFVLSSPREGLSIALLEAMENGLPCVVTCIDQRHPALVHGQNGLIVATYDEISLNKALLHLISDKKTACRMGNEARKTVLERYTVERMARSYRDVFHRCMEK